MNKTLLASLLVAALAAATHTAEAQRQARTGYEIKKIETDDPFSPDFGSNYGKRSTPQKWLETEAEFEAENPNDSELTEELMFRYYIYFADAIDAATGEPKPSIYSGEVTHVNVPDDRRLYSVMYISPQSLYRIFGKSVSPGTLGKYIAVEILKDGQLVAVNFTSRPPNAAQEDWWNELDPVLGHLRNKNETPFMPLVWDRYQEIKTRN